MLGLFGRARAEERVMPEAVARPATLLIAEVDDVAQRLSEHLLSLSINERLLVRRNEGEFPEFRRAFFCARRAEIPEILKFVRETLNKFSRAFMKMNCSVATHFMSQCGSNARPV